MLEGLMLKLKLQYFGHLMRRADSFEKTLMLGKIEDRRRRGRQRMKWFDGIKGWDGSTASMTWWTWVWASSGSWWWTGKPGMLQSMGLQRIGHDWVTELNWIESHHVMKIEGTGSKFGAESQKTWILSSLIILPCCKNLRYFSKIHHL